MGFLVTQREKDVPLLYLNVSAGPRIDLSKCTMRLRLGEMSTESLPPLILSLDMPLLPEITLHFDVYNLQGHLRWGYIFMVPSFLTLLLYLCYPAWISCLLRISHITHQNAQMNSNQDGCPVRAMISLHSHWTKHRYQKTLLH